MNNRRKCLGNDVTWFIVLTSCQFEEDSVNNPFHLTLLKSSVLYDKNQNIDQLDTNTWIESSQVHLPRLQCILAHSQTFCTKKNNNPEYPLMFCKWWMSKWKKRANWKFENPSQKLFFLLLILFSADTNRACVLPVSYKNLLSFVAVWMGTAGFLRVLHVSASSHWDYFIILSPPGD